MHLTQHAKERMEQRKIPMSSVTGAIQAGKIYVQPDGVKVYEWLGLQVVVDEHRIVTAFDRLKDG